MPSGLRSDYIEYLSQQCLNKTPHILPCDIFNSQATLSDNSAFICNLERSGQSGSHYVCILILDGYILYFDPLGFPIISSYILPKLKTCKKPITIQVKVYRDLFLYFVLSMLYRF